MRIGMIVPRYGADVAGGAETACRAVASRLAAADHQVTVVSSCARSYVDWADHHPPGVTTDGAVTVVRLPVAHRRDPERFAALSERVVGSPHGAPRHVELAWMEAQGPVLEGLAETVAGLAVDVMVVWTYLYASSWTAARECRRLGIPTVLVPTAHDEPTMHLDVVREVLEAADGFAFLTPEEADLVAGISAMRGRPDPVVGLGLEEPMASEAERRMARRLVGDDPYSVCVGRLDPSKGTVALVAAVGDHRARHPEFPDLVLVGDPAHDIELPPGVRHVGLVDEATKRGLLAEAVCLVQPSPFESFSIVLLEAWAQARPVVVSGACAVTAGQVRRSGGGAVFADGAELVAAVEVLHDREDLAARLGRHGQAYLGATYRWEHVLAKWEAVLAEVAGSPGPGSSR